MNPNIIEITDLNRPELEVYTRLSENQMRHYFEPNGGIFLAESPMVVERALRLGYEPLSLLVEKKYLAERGESLLSCCGNVPVFSADFDQLARQTGFRFQLSRGALCAMRRKPLPSVEEICRDARRICILENVVNPTNVGAIFRSAAALNIDAILLTPASSDPLYRRSIRVSMATVFQIPWTFFDDPDASWRSEKNRYQESASSGSDSADHNQRNKLFWPSPALEKLHDMGFKTVAMALKDDSVSMDDPALLAEDKLAIIMGTEGDGLADKTIDNCDYTVRIPMAHGVDSLNVAAASAVAFWQLRAR